MRCEGEGWDMSSYASYCQDQATACARRARLASSPEIVAYCRNLQFRWLRLAAQAQLSESWRKWLAWAKLAEIEG